MNKIIIQTDITELIEQALIEGNNLEKINGGLFNEVYRWHVDENNCYYLKEYQNKNVSTIFSPPKIDKSIRSRLAFEVHKIFNDVNKDFNICTDVYFIEKKNLLAVKGVNNPKELIHYLSSGEILWKNIQMLITGLARLHRYTADKSLKKEELYMNTQFRDFKLQLQYYNLAKEINSDIVANEILDLVERYKLERMSILHGDINSRNIIINQNDESMGIIDFEQSHVGNPIYDLAYILSEVYISCLNYEINTDKIAKEILDVYQENNPEFNFWSSIEDFRKHLGVQILYRFIGPSRDSWTFYVKDDAKRDKIIQLSKALILNSSDKVIDNYL